jgi:hypothetical protein
MDKHTYNIGAAMQALEEGKRVRRLAWPSEMVFVFRQVPAKINKKILPKMNSLPPSVKAYFKEKFETSEQDFFYYKNQIALVKPDNQITGYSPTMEDLLSEDWLILD